MKNLINSIKDGLLFQLKYSLYSLKRWPSIIILYLLGICLLGILEPIEIFFQKELVSLLTSQTDIYELSVLTCLYFIVSTLFIFQSYSSPIVQRIVGLKVASWIEGKIYLNIQNSPLELLDSADYQIKIDHAKESVIHISSGPALLMYNISYLISLLIPTLQLIKYPLLLVLYYALGILAAIYNIKHTQATEQLHKSMETDRRAMTYYQNLQQSKELIAENRIHRYDVFFKEKWEVLNESVFLNELRLKKRQSKENIIVSIFQQIIGVIPVTIMYFMLINHTGDIATYTLVTGMGGIITRYIGYLSTAFSKSSSCGIYTNDIEEVLKSTDSVEKKPEEICYNNNKPILEMKNVYFHYPNSKDVLKNINLSVYENETIALVGENGSGKTTLSLLALGLYKPQTGSVSICGKDINETNHDIQEIMSPVFQDFIKYEFKVRENIGFGNINQIDNDKLLNIASAYSGFQETLVSRNMSYESYLGKHYEKDGEELSGGEWQRVAISRGLFGNGRLLLLDEPTASLDPISEIRLFNTLKNCLSNHAAIIVSHRIGICKLVDNIVFLKDGKIVEVGTHHDLYELKGNYYKFYNEQAKWYRGDKVE